MPEMPSAEMRTMSHPVRGISSKDVEGLVLEIKENLRLSATTMKALPCSHLSRKSSRASPYRVPGKGSCCEIGSQRKVPEPQEDPYELLQKLLRDGSLVNEAVRRVQLGLSSKQRYFYESEEDNSPVLRLFQDNSI